MAKFDFFFLLPCMWSVLYVTGNVLCVNTALSCVYVTQMDVWESMGKLCSCMQFIESRIFKCNLCDNLYQVLQVMCTASERAMKLKVLV